MAIIQTVIRNYSKYPIDVVWENAQDLEHVDTLHPHTNKAFELLYAGKHAKSPRVYETLFFESKRKLMFLTFNSYGFREVVKEYNFQQMERLPALGMTTCLNSLLIKTGEKERPTMLLDEVVIEVPSALKWLEPLIIRSFRRHTAIQCVQDESLRKRRVELTERGIHLPYRLFSDGKFTALRSLFKEDLK